MEEGFAIYVEIKVLESRTVTHSCLSNQYHDDFYLHNLCKGLTIKYQYCNISFLLPKSLYIYMCIFVSNRIMSISAGILEKVKSKIHTIAG